MRFYSQRERVVGVSYSKQQQGYIDEFDYYENRLVRETIICGLVVRRKVIDREFVPSHAVISQGCFGDTGGFVSRFAPFDKHGNLLPT